MLTNSRYQNYDFGNGANDDVTIAYREGDLKLTGSVQGAGILVVTGDLDLGGDFRYDGIVICLGEVKNSGTAQIYGAFVSGPVASRILAMFWRCRRVTNCCSP